MHRILNEAMYIGSLATSLVVAASVFEPKLTRWHRSVVAVFLGLILFVDAVPWRRVWETMQVLNSSPTLPPSLCWIDLFAIAAGLLSIGFICNGRFDASGCPDPKAASFFWMLGALLVYMFLAYAYWWVLSREPDESDMWGAISQGWGVPRGDRKLACHRAFLLYGLSSIAIVLLLAARWRCGSSGFDDPIFWWIFAVMEFAFLVIYIWCGPFRSALAAPKV